MRLIKPMEITNDSVISSNVAESDYPLYNSSTSYNINDTIMVLSIPQVVTLSVAAPCIIQWTNHSLPEGTGVVFTTTGNLPVGLTSGQTYYIINAQTNYFSVSATPSGNPVTTSGTQSGTHTCTANWHKNYQSLVGSNIGNSPQNSPTKWLDLGYTNFWSMFDNSVGSQTSNAGTIDITFRGFGRIDSLAFLNVVATSIRVIVTDAVDGVVYDKTRYTTSNSGTASWYNYFFDPIVTISDMIITDLLPYNNALIRVVLDSSNNTAYCGSMILGQQYYLGRSEFGIKNGIQDYSVKQRDDFGNYYVLQRAFNRTSSVTVWVDAADVDDVYNVLSQYRATPIVYVGDDVQISGVEPYTSTYVYGYYKQYTIEISYPTESVLTIDLEGLT